MQQQGIISSVHIVSGMPHILLSPEKNLGWKQLNEAYGLVRKQIEEENPDIILYFSTQWLSILGYMFQADPNPEWVYVDQNWHELGSIPYQFKVDDAFASAYAEEVAPHGYQTKLINYHGFPIDTGTVVAQKLLNPDNKFKAAMVSCNMYSEKVETSRVGQAAARALANQGKKAVAVLVSNLSNRMHTQKIDVTKDHLSCQKDHEWNQKVLDMLSKGGLEDVSQCVRDFAKQANGDMQFKGIWWLNGLCGMHNDFQGKVHSYHPVWGTGAAVVSLTPTTAIHPQNLEHVLASEEGSQADMMEELTNFEAHLKGDFATQAQSQKSTHPEKTLKAASDDMIVCPTSPKAVGPYPHARRFGDLLFLCGMGPRKKEKRSIPGVTLDKDGNIKSYDIEAQTRSVIENIKEVLEYSGSSLERVVDIQVFLTNMKDDFQAFNRIYGEYFKDIAPTRTTVEVGSLPTPIAVELKVIART